ncbi:hypothetical protein BOX15_Mlig033110g1 [Macrostomum lignano]|uniref:Uncharacterized protein n=2 Tax=Macrostomum lignano TaxID=282301 RepID=A0A267GYW0_9PLAT|nr:hypothetical protein BOX15_Mlig033110g1 [Macrostomum lignano]
MASKALQKATVANGNANGNNNNSNGCNGVKDEDAEAVPDVEAELLEFVPADGGLRAWLVCFTSFCTNGTIFSIINSFGIISDWLITTRGISKSVAGSIGSATIGCVFFFSFLGSIVMDRVGLRRCAFAGGLIAVCSFMASSFVPPENATVLFFTHSCLFGFGAALVYTPSLVILGHHFDKRLGLANGIVTLGSGVFSVVLSRSLKPLLLDRIGVHNTFRVYCGMAAFMLVYSFTWKPLRPVRHAELDHYLSQASLTERLAGVRAFLTKFLNVSIWQNRGFLIWIVGCPFALFGYFVPFMFLPNFVQERALELANLTLADIDTALAASASNATSAGAAEAAAAILAVQEQAQTDSAVLLICINVASGVCRIVTGRLADFRCVNRVRLQQAAFCILGVSICLFPLCSHRVPMILLALLFGACDGTFVCMIGPIAFDLVGPTGASQAIGFLLQMISIPTTTGPLITGYINDCTGRWDLPFYISGASPIIGSLVMFFIPPTKQAYPAATVAEDFDQMTKSNLDIQAYDEALTDPDGIWQKAPSVMSLTRSNASLAASGGNIVAGHLRRRRLNTSETSGTAVAISETAPLTSPEALSGDELTEAAGDEAAAEAAPGSSPPSSPQSPPRPTQNGKTCTEITIRESTI